MALITDMGVDGVGGEVLQPMLKNRFRLRFIGLGGSRDAHALTIQAITAARPKLSFQEVVMDRYNSKVYVAGKHSFETTTVVFESDTGGKVVENVKRQLEDQQHIIGMTARHRLAAAPAGSQYKFALAIEQLDGDSIVYETWYLEGCWLQTVDWGDLDYGASETIKITLTIRYDHAREDITGVDHLAIGGTAGSNPTTDTGLNS